MKDNICTECGKEQTNIKSENKWYCSDCYLLYVSDDMEAYCYYEAEEVRKGVKKI